MAAMPSECGSDFFECTQCGSCCQGYGGTCVGEKDIAAIAGYLGVSEHEIRTRYCVFSGNKAVLSQKDDGYCVFWDQNCTIHPVKPLMCRQWPFIHSLLVDAVNWQIMAASCPGIRREVDIQTLLRYTRKTIGCTGNDGRGACREQVDTP
jgi:uncharacterized protein